MNWRLLLVSEPGKDGVFSCVRTLARHLRSHHPDIMVDLAYSSRRAGPALADFVKEVEAGGGITADLQVANAPERGDWNALRKLRRLARERRYRLVHAHSSKAGALARLAALAPGFPPVLYTPHAYFGMPRQGGRKEMIFNGIESVLGRIGTTHNCSEDERDFAHEVLHLPEDRLKVIHHGIDTTVFAPAGEDGRAASRETLGLPSEGRLLVTIGRDSAQKNYAPLYTALARLLPAADWQFAHAGAGSLELRAGLPTAAAARCHAFAHLEDTAPLLRAANGFILTSRYEGLSLSMLHALSCGLELILTEAPGLRVLKTLGFQGIHWLPDPAAAKIGDPLDAALVHWAAGNTGDAAHQRELAVKFFSEPVQLEKLVALIRRLARA
jgi:glycosyltransferase involved in cell wall biosynthesis